jgi:hypothetical protein
MKAHLTLNFPGVTARVGETLCGQVTAIAAEGDSLSNEFEKTTNLTINEIVTATANDNDKTELCNRCLGEFFDNVLPLSWEWMDREAEAAKKMRTSLEWKN